MLMPAPYFEEDFEKLARRSAPGETPILGVGRDVVGRRKDGSNFQMHLSVGEVTLGDERMYIGTLHDLSSYRQEVAGPGRA